MKLEPAKLLKQFLISKKFEAIRYLILGGICAIGHVIFIYFLTDIVGIFYLYSTVISFLLTSFLGYFGQKYFAYRNFESKHPKQLSLYFFIILIGLVMDANLMLLFVSIAKIHYIIASIITRSILLVINFLWSKHITFKKRGALGLS